MIKATRRPIRIPFKDMSGGVRFTDDMTKIRNNQVQDALNAILRKEGIQRRPGSTALTSFNLATTTKGLFFYTRLDGTQTLLMVNGGKVYAINTTDGTPTELYDLTGTGNGYFTNYLDKCWVVNGTGAAKVESSSVAYQVGITAPNTSATLSAVSGGSLPDGTYTVYISYARDNNLYSVAESLGTVALTAPNSTIRITGFTNSADAQVNNKVVWILEPGGTVIYYYHETGDNTTTTINITSTAQKNTSKLYNVLAVNNNFPGDGTIPAFEYIHSYDGRIWGSNNNELYYSLKNDENVYDLERFFPTNYRTYPYEAKGHFDLNGDLYINTPNGIIRQPNADPLQEWEIVERRWYFKYWNTVVDYRGGKLGLTNDGIKWFDGEKFVDYDISYDVRAEIEKIYGSTAGFEPCGAIYRRSFRTEYHLCYNDDNLSTASNNARLVLNLNKLEFLPEKRVIAPWEPWSNGATHLAVDSSENMYHAQSHATAPKIYKDDANNTVDNGIYLRDGTLGTSASNVYLKVFTKAHLLDMQAVIRWNILRTMIRLSSAVTITVVIRDTFGLSSENSIGSGEGTSLWGNDDPATDGFVWDIDTWDTNTLGPRKTKLPIKLEGYIVYLKIEQTANDKNLLILETELSGISVRSRFT